MDGGKGPGQVGPETLEGCRRVEALLLKREAGDVGKIRNVPRNDPAASPGHFPGVLADAAGNALERGVEPPSLPPGAEIEQTGQVGASPAADVESGRPSGN